MRVHISLVFLLFIVCAMCGVHAYAKQQAQGVMNGSPIEDLKSHGIRHVSSYALFSLPVLTADSNDYYFGEKMLPHEPDYRCDDKGVPIYINKSSGEPSTHPVSMTYRGGKCIYAYTVAINDPERDEYLKRAGAIGESLLEIAIEKDGALLFPYGFDLRTHKAPWFSGLAQGQALSLFVNLFNLTGKKRYRDAADKIFTSFFFFYPESYDERKPWISYVDENGYYWIEEYPRKNPQHVLNGFQYAVLGLYQYWMLSKTPESEFLIRASLATISEHAEKYRHPGSISRKRLLYNLESKTYNYHLVHILLLRKLYDICGDPNLYRVAHLFELDRIAYKKAGRLQVEIQPTEAEEAGGRWRRVGTKQWFKSGYVEWGIADGDHEIEFKTAHPKSKWKRPSNQKIRIKMGMNAEAAGVYNRKMPPSD